MLKKQKKIVFTAATPMNYIMFKPISDRLLTDDRIDVVFTANHSPRKLYGALGVKNVKLIRHEIAEWKKFDMCIFNYHYEECVFETSTSTEPVYAVFADDLVWFEIDTEKDLKKAREQIYPEIKRLGVYKNG